MIRLEKIVKQNGRQLVFVEASAALQRGEKVGLVGPNGAGKTTLFNVLNGTMSLVGPRPHPIGMKTAGEDSARLVAEYAWRHRMKPGITGWAQIHGSRGPVHTAEEVRRRVELDIDYIERQSFWLDLYVLVMTLPRLLGDGEAVR